jgi:4-hydroxy-tetrahydrodipicolinate synthase
VDWQIAAGTHGLVPCGTTGESPTLTHEEHNRVVALCVEAAKGRVPVIAGAGSNSTAEAIALASHAQRVGADAVLVVTPYYNKPTQEGLYQHYKAIHDAADLPVIIYNIPSRSVIDMSLETMARLAKLPNIVGVKDATNDLARPVRTRTVIGPSFCQLSGEDGTAVAFLSQGGAGCISVTSNLVPDLCAQLQNSWVAGNLDRVAVLRDQLAELNQVLFCESNPAPVKYAASLLGKCDGSVRLPLVEISDASRFKVQTAMKGLGLI